MNSPPRRALVRSTVVSGLLAVVSLLFCLCAAAAQESFRLSVAPDGATDVSRSNGRPLALSAALEEAARRRSIAPTTPLVIELQNGTYYLDKPIVIDARISGEGGITIMAKPGADARLVGWRNVDVALAQGPKEIEDQLPAAARGKIRYYSLPAAVFPDLGIEAPRGYSFPRRSAEIEFFANDSPLSPARWPAVGYSEIASVEGGTRVVLRDTPLAAVADRADVWFSGFPGVDWAYQRIRVVGVERASGVIRIGQPFAYQPRPGDFAALEGPPGLFSAPGQFYLDRPSRTLAVWPASLETQAIHASVLDNAIEITDARHVRIEGLSVLGVRGDAIRVVNSDDVRIKRVQVADAGMRGVVVEGGRDFLLQNSVTRDTGDESVWVMGGDRKSLVPANHRIRNNVLLRFARRTRGGRGIWLDGVGNVVEANVISDSPSLAIHFQGNDHIIRHNDITRVASECGDCAAIYTGRDWTARGSCIDGNVIHGIVPAPHRNDVNAIYLDDGASGILVQGNLVVGLRRGILLGGGRDNVIMDNTIVGADQYGILVDARGTTWAARSVTDASSEIRRKLTTVPYDKEPYRSRYPHLAELLQDEPGMPKYNWISGNGFFGGEGIRLEHPSLSALLSDAQPLARQTAPQPGVAPEGPFACGLSIEHDLRAD